MQTIHLAANPEFKSGRPWSYESVLCRLHAGWWVMGDNTLTASEVIALRVVD